MWKHTCAHHAEPYLVSRTEGLLHGMQSVSHWIDGIYDKAHLGVLGILMAQRLSPCGEQRPTHKEKPISNCFNLKLTMEKIRIWIQARWPVESVQRGVEHKTCVVLTGACSVVNAALLQVSPQPALEAVLPEFREPGVPQVGIRLQVQVIVIKPGHICWL